MDHSLFENCTLIAYREIAKLKKSGILIARNSGSRLSINREDFTYQRKD